MTQQELASTYLLFHRPFLSLYYRENPIPEELDLSNIQNFGKTLNELEHNLNLRWSDHTLKCLQFLNLTNMSQEAIAVRNYFFPNMIIPEISKAELYPHFLDFHLLLELETMDFNNDNLPAINQWLDKVCALPSKLSIFHILKLSYDLDRDTEDILAKEIHKRDQLMNILQEIHDLCY